MEAFRNILDNLEIPNVFYETGRSNSGNYERFSTKAAAFKRARAIAEEFDEDVRVDMRTEEDPITSWEVRSGEKV